MNKESFIQVLRNPKGISADQLAQVEEVVEQFPYFQIARSVIASGSKSLQNEDAQIKLAKAAIYTTNRQLLKKYVNGKFDFDIADRIQIGIHRETQSKTISSGVETKKRPKFRIIERRNSHDDKTIVSSKFVDLTKKVKVDDIDEELTVIDADGVEKTTVTHTSIKTAQEQADKEAAEAIEETPQVEAPASVVEEVEEVEVEKEEVKEAPTVVIEEEIAAPKAVVEKLEEPKFTGGELVDDVLKNLEQYRHSRDHYLEVEQKILNQQESDAIQDAIEKANTKIKTGDKSSVAPKTEKKTTAPKSAATKPESPARKTTAKKETPKKSSSVTNHKATATAKIKEPKATKAASPIEMVPEKVDNNIIDKPQTESTSSDADSTDKKEVQKEIIERFIKSNPKILPADEEPKGEISDLSTSSAEMKDDIATENLAMILVRQGKREKAIEIYEKLILKIPKKKSYFAARIAELK